MDYRTISDNFREQIGSGQRVLAAVFTTYNFEPEFFELEIIPLMLDQNLAYSSDPRIKRIQVREALGHAGVPLEVFYDLDMFRHQQPVSPAMEYLHHGIRGERSAFHAKLVFLLLQDKQTGEQSLRVGAGSANLTGAGWWENIECQHWEHVSSGEVSRRFLGQIRADVDWLANKRLVSVGGAGTAVGLVKQYLGNCKASNTADTVSYYGLNSLQLGQVRRPAFMKFLLDAQNEQCGNYNHWSLEIISPYFADSAAFDGHKYFFDDLKVDAIRIFLPVNDQGEALCRQDYYEKIEKDGRIEWATWAPEICKSLGLDANAKRKTHAKIYHFYNGVQSWVFVGSVNFTHRATSDNQEAGFFAKLPARTTLLKSLKSPPDKWCSEKDLAGTDGEKDADHSLPIILLSYDWKARVLRAAVQGDEAVVINVLTPERHAIVRELNVTRTAATVPCQPEVIEALLEGSGFLWVAGRWSDRGAVFAEHVALVQQTNWTHKPLDLPTLSPQEIMQIYAGLNLMRRNQVIEHLKERQLREMGLGGDASGNSGFEQQANQFFAEYAELFHAFRNLRKRLAADWDAQRFNQVDYYLSGRGLDSLPTLLESLFENDRKLDSATIYLALLCLIQIYQQPGYGDRAQVATILADCMAKVSTLEQSGQLKLIDADAERSARFFRWYKEQFFRNAVFAEAEVDHAAN